MKRLFLLVLLACCSAARSQDSTIADVTVPSAEDGKVAVRFNKVSGLPLPASDDRAEILGANISFEPHPDNATKIYWGWAFVVRFKGNAQPVSIVVEDETRAPIALECQASAPKLKEGVAVCSSPTRPLSKQFVEFVQTGKPMFFLHRFTIRYADGSVSKLHQPSLHPASTLMSMITTVASMVGPKPVASGASSK